VQQVHRHNYRGIDGQLQLQFTKSLLLPAAVTAAASASAAAVVRVVKWCPTHALLRSLVCIQLGEQLQLRGGMQSHAMPSTTCHVTMPLLLSATSKSKILDITLLNL
jgi:hypothetical protein